VGVGVCLGCVYVCGQEGGGGSLWVVDAARRSVLIAGKLPCDPDVASGRSHHEMMRRARNLALHFYQATAFAYSTMYYTTLHPSTAVLVLGPPTSSAPPQAGRPAVLVGAWPQQQLVWVGAGVAE
jgi:hypothetical protein